MIKILKISRFSDFKLEANVTIFSIGPIKKKHRIIGINEACVLELAFGRVLETDIVRYEDDYGRT